MIEAQELELVEVGELVRKVHDEVVVEQQRGEVD